jgi:hypothetical protein
MAEFHIMAFSYVPRERGDAMMHIDHTQATALAAFVGRIRPDWDHPGIVAAIGKARGLGSAAAVGAALCRLAENLELRTPAMLPDPGNHWGGTTVASRQAPSMCPDHPTEKAGPCLESGPCSLEVIKDRRRAAALAAQVKAAIPRRQTVHKHPTPPATDVREARARIDAEETQ